MASAPFYYRVFSGFIAFYRKDVEKFIVFPLNF